MLNEKVLMLNYSYEPLKTITVRDAMTKVLKFNSAVRVLSHHKGKYVRTVTQAYPAPSVIILDEYAFTHRNRRDRTRSNRTQIYERDDYTCQYCGKHLKHQKKNLTLDHIVPKCKGGATVPSNLVTACRKCNGKKGDNSPRDAKMVLRITETLLRVPLDQVGIYKTAQRYPDWLNYLYLSGNGEESLQHIDE
jgi:5-methylcytosine-specific restriction endonuclease McrA